MPALRPGSAWFRDKVEGGADCTRTLCFGFSVVGAVLGGAVVGGAAPLVFVASFDCQKAKAAFFLSSAVDI